MSTWKTQLILGVLFVVAGLLVLFNPFAASLAVEQLAGWLFLAIGIVQLIEAFVAEGWSGKVWSVLIGLVAAIIGLNLIAKPMAGLMALTLIVGIMFLVSGVVKLIIGWPIPLRQLRFAVILSGIVSLLLGLVILGDFPGSAVAAIGILLGIELVSNGVLFLFVALGLRKLGHL